MNRMRIGSCMAATVVGACMIVTQVFAQTAAIYPEPTVSAADLKAALAKAGREHKRVILDFGGNWCGDCKALAALFHKSPNSELLKKSFVLVEVNIGRFDQNLDIAKKYEVPLKLGVPALAVLDEKGNLVFSQKKGEFESMRTMDPNSVNKFLEKWKPSGSNGNHA